MLKKYFSKKITYQNVKDHIFSRQFCIQVIAVALTIGYTLYLPWSASIARNTVLFSTIPELTISLLFSSIVAVIFTLLYYYKARPDTSVKNIFGALFCFFFLPLTLTLNWASSYVYLFPEKTLSYATDYDVTFPGPYSSGRSGRCEAGLLIKETYTSRWLNLCSSQKALRLGEHKKQGMDGVFVTVKVNRVGAWISHYEFTWK